MWVNGGDRPNAVVAANEFIATKLPFEGGETWKPGAAGRSHGQIAFVT
jgi:hypothetical protein